MKKVVCVFWQSYHNALAELLPEIREVLDIRLYASKSFDEGAAGIDDLRAECADADLTLLYPAGNESCWKEIDERLGKLPSPRLYLGGEGAAKNAPGVLEAAAVCNRYISAGGKRNMRNMIFYAARSIAGAELECGEVEDMPWDGVYHPDAPGYFDSPEAYFAWRPRRGEGVIALLMSRFYWLNGNKEPEDALIRAIEARGFSALAVFASDLRNSETGAPGIAGAVEKYLFDRGGRPIPDCLVKFSSFLFENHAEEAGQSRRVLSRLNCPVIKPIVSAMTIDQWRADEYGTAADLAWSVALPEMEGVIEPVFIAGLEKNGGIEKRKPLPDRLEKTAERAVRWSRLKRKANADKKIVFVLNNNPCTGTEASAGGAANLDALESLARILRRLRQEGYAVENPPKDGKELIETIMARKAVSEFRWTTVQEIVDKGGVIARVEKAKYLEWFQALPRKARGEVIAAWGEPPGEERNGVPPAMLHEGALLITGVRYGSALVCVQPKRGCAGPRCDGAVCKILHDPRVPPTHQYIAAYKYFEHEFKADALIHVGTHGNLEFLPGKGTGLSENCYPDICAGHLPCLYIYNSDNPPEGTIAKRRALAVIVDHLQAVLTQSGVYGEIETLDSLLAQYDKTPVSSKAQAHLLEHQIKEALEKAKMDAQIDITNYHERFLEIKEAAHAALSLIKNTRIQDGMHIFGAIPQGEEEIMFLSSVVRYESAAQQSLRAAVSRLIGLDLTELLAQSGAVSARYGKNNGAILFDIDRIVQDILRIFIRGGRVDASLPLAGYRVVDESQIARVNEQRERVMDIRRRLQESKEIEALLSGLSGAFIPPGRAGAVSRGHDDVLPTGRNFFTLDPRSIPTPAAWEIGRRLGDRVIEKYVAEEKRYPENFSMYWMCSDITWADGEGMSQLLYLIGAEPKRLPNGRVTGFAVIPLRDLGRPRIDVTVKLSGILRDNFMECVTLLDDAVKAVAALDEDPQDNYIRKHALENMRNDGSLDFDAASRRIFGAKPGAYVSGISLAVYASAWKDRKDFLDLFTYFNGYAYGRSAYGDEAFKQLQNNLKTVDIAYNKVASDEHDLLGCCCYFANHGGMAAAAKELSGKDVKTWYGDTREASNVEVRTLADELRRVARARLLNPKWIAGQKRHGYAGAMNISKRIGRVYGWDAATGDVDDGVFDAIAKTFIADRENRAFFMENNPWALEEIARRLIEAHERSLWRAEDGLMAEIRDAYLDIESFMEESMGSGAGEFQGGSIDSIDLNELENYRNHTRRMRAALAQEGKG
ncbi:MAG: cobaltochelatase subunit CobN [Treponema sp.]|jgi:cobaltochelatase CobN|nr:cobaltochelatase subunit CobN [Treponema sp.]